MVIKALQRLDADQLITAWAVYQACFTDLNARTIQRHLATKDEFAGIAADERITKYLATADDGAVMGLSTYTNDLDAMPLISADYFRARYPLEFLYRRIFYCGFVGVAPQFQGSSAFRDLVEAMYLQAFMVGGVISLDLCRENDQRMAGPIRMMMHRLDPGVQARRADTQNYWIYETGSNP